MPPVTFYRGGFQINALRLSVSTSRISLPSASHTLAETVGRPIMRSCRSGATRIYESRQTFTLQSHSRLGG